MAVSRYPDRCLTRDPSASERFETQLRIANGSHHLVNARLARYAAALERAGADAFVLTSEPALQHAAGIRLYSQRLIPQRPVACIVAPPAPPICVCVEYEVGQLGLEAPGLELRSFGELTGDPWQLVASALDERSARHVVVEDTFLARWLVALEERFTGRIEVSFETNAAPPVT